MKFGILVWVCCCFFFPRGIHSSDFCLCSYYKVIQLLIDLKSDVCFGKEAAI